MSKKKQTLREAINEQYDKAVEGTLETPSGISDDQKEVFMIGAAWAYRNALNMLGKPLTLKEFATKSGCVLRVQTDKSWGGAYAYSLKDAPGSTYCGYKTEDQVYNAWLADQFGPSAARFIRGLLA